MESIEAKVAEPQTEELALVDAARHGDVGAFEQLIKRYDRNVFRIAQHITQNREDAEDVVQDAFLKAYSNLGQFQGQSKFYTWLVRIAVNEALMKLRRRRPERMVSLDEEVKTEEDSLPREVAAAAGSVAVAGTAEPLLPETCERRWQTVKCSEFLHDLTNYLDGVLDD